MLAACVAGLGLLVCLAALAAPSGSRVAVGILGAFLICIGGGFGAAAASVLRSNREGRPQRISDHQWMVQIHVPDDDPLYLAIRAVVQRHVHTLALEQRKRLVPDKYGVVDSASWDSEVDAFIDRVAWPHLTKTVPPRQLARSQALMIRNVLRRMPYADRANVLRATVRAVIEAELAAHEATSAPARPSTTYSSPAELEAWCASTLRECGWTAQVMGGSGDQGVDVRASIQGTVLVVQCKLYSQPVGNGAVQEVFAGKAFYRADYAAVLSTAGFTKAARAVAAQTGVHLLTPDELAPFARRTGAESPRLA